MEPKRFEDLVRQLDYDFKPWRKLEATGRSGSDDGFDARGYEIVGADVSLNFQPTSGRSRTGHLMTHRVARCVCVGGGPSTTPKPSARQFRSRRRWAGA